MTAHNEVTLALAKKECAEHMHGMKELYDEMRKRPLIIKAYALDDPEAPSIDDEISSTANPVKIIHFVRHGQGFHNLFADIYTEQGRTWVQYKPEGNPYAQNEIYDAPLTEKGRQQAIQLQPIIESFNNPPIELVIMSPNCRALMTGVLAFEKLIGKIPFLSHEMVREETGIHICDKRRSKSRQEKEFPQVDFTLLESDEDRIYQTNHRETKAEVGERVYKFMEWLSQRSEKSIGIASHSSWLLTVFNGICESNDDKLKAWFQTGELRSVKLEFVRR